MSITLTLLLTAGAALFLKNQVGPWLRKLSESIDKWIDIDGKEFDKFRNEVFGTLHQTKHPLGKDGFEKLT